MKRMLINATQPEELRVALVDGQRLYDVDIESASREQKKSNIYKAKVVRIEPSLEAAFVDFGAERHGFLPFKEIARSLFKEKDDGGRGRFNIKDHLQVGQELIVQVEKPERGNKGAALTTFVSLAGRYLVLMPNNPRAGGVSRQIEGDDRSEAREAMSSVSIPTGMGMILRTAGVGKSGEELQWDLDYLLKVWEAIESAAKERSAPFLIYRESEVIIRAIRDYLRQDINEILIDNEEVYNRAHEFMSQVMPHNLNKLKLYTEHDPLFTRYQVENQIESAFAREVTLPSGGAVIIDHTEALITIDINSARATAGGDIEETALNTNLEAAEEIARQLRLRDIGGLIVIDFIDMMNAKNQREVENRLRESVKDDRARVQINRLSRFGLLEMSRQRLRPSLGESSHIVCPRCSGTGHLRSVESLSLSVFRIIEEEAMKENTAKVIAHLPVEVATFLLNEKRSGLRDIETRLDVELILIPKAELETPRYKVQRLRKNDEDQLGEVQQSSYKLSLDEDGDNEEEEETGLPGKQSLAQPVVKQVMPNRPSPQHEAPKQDTGANGTSGNGNKSKGLISRLFGSLFGVPETGSDSASQSANESASTTETGQSATQQSASGASSQRSGSSSSRRGQSSSGSRGNSGNQRERGRRSNKRSSGSSNSNSSGARSSANSGSGDATTGDSTANSASDSANSNAAASTEDSSESRKPRSSSRRGRRGGRRRRRNDGSNTGDSNNQNTDGASSADKTSSQGSPGNDADGSNKAADEKQSENRSASSGNRRQGNNQSNKPAATTDANKPDSDATGTAETAATAMPASDADKTQADTAASETEKPTEQPAPQADAKPRAQDEAPAAATSANDAGNRDDDPGTGSNKQQADTTDTTQEQPRSLYGSSSVQPRQDDNGESGSADGTQTKPTEESEVK
ncbi:ribonuclease E [Methylohalomonas lacus]|uniref:Ribonuclease E n=1 Tax=Methylohalomonas lacus TaxID=398773 RepID=A0AAE3HK88_9GAMM|nr:ribonuclease E [Methylohalomonas lacus]MCS3902624.1 ribonuclease E [Methylohalomonas lacus]